MNKCRPYTNLNIRAQPFTRIKQNDIIKIQILRGVYLMEKVLNKILTKLEKLDKMELDIKAVKSDIKDIKSDVKQVDKKVNAISEVVAKTMEDVTELKDKVDKQDVEIRVIKGGI